MHGLQRTFSTREQSVPLAFRLYHGHLHLLLFSNHRLLHNKGSFLRFIVVQYALEKEKLDVAIRGKLLAF